MRRFLVLLLVLGAALFVVVLTRQPRQGPVTLTGGTMGTTYRVRLVADLSTVEQQRWQARIEKVLSQVNADMSTYQPQSDICRFNRTDSCQWQAVSADTAQVVAAALEIARQTEGAFDITVAPLVNLWSFGPDQRPRGIPAEDDIQAALARVGFSRVEARRDPPALRKQRPDVAIDLSGIAKGFAVDQLAKLLENGGIENYLIEVGGEVRTKGTKAEGQAWMIGLERPWADQRAVESVLAVQECCLASSGNYRNFFEWEDEVYSHEIDPHTGWPVRHHLVAVSVIGRSTMQADALATGFMILEPDMAWRLADNLNVEACLTVYEDGEFKQRMTPGFAKLTK